jgi:hypothetical protein
MNEHHQDRIHCGVVEVGFTGFVVLIAWLLLLINLCQSQKSQKSHPEENET